MKRSLISLAVLAALSACGGGGGDDNASEVNVPEKITIEVVDGRGTSMPPPSTGYENPPPVQNPPPADNEPEPPKEHEQNPGFTAELYRAPADGASFCGLQFLEVEGTGIKNVEMVAGNTYERLWVFNVNPAGTYAWAWYDPRIAFKPGPVQARILAWDQTAGKMANEIEVMPQRTWYVRPSCPLNSGSEVEKGMAEQAAIQ